MFHPVINGIILSNGLTLAEATAVTENAEKHGASVDVVYIPVKS